MRRAPTSTASAPLLACTDPCNDGNPCTQNDHCSNGACVGTLPPFVTYCQGDDITIPDSGAATPYPSTVSVSGGPFVCKVKVTLDGIGHTFPDDIDMLLSGPGGQNAKIMSDVGGSADLPNGLFLGIDDSAASSFPDGGPLLMTPGPETPLGGGTYRPTDINDGPDAFPAPAPAPAGGSALSVFNGTNPNGTWNLWIVDDKVADSGSLSRWCLQVSFLCTADAQCPDDNEPCTNDVCVSGVCTHVSNALPCDDQDPCSENDHCGDGFCSGTYPTTVPPEAQGLRVGVPNKQTISWSPALHAPAYDVVRGALAALPVGPGGGDEVCFNGVVGTSMPDTELPAPGAGYWYLVRGINCNGSGIYGFRSNGVPRATGTCP